MKRKRMIKLLMSVGFDRNAAVREADACDGRTSHIRIILTDKDNGIVLDIFGLKFARLDHLLLLLSDTLQQHGCRFVIRVLWH